MISDQEKTFVSNRFSFLDNIPMGMLVLRSDHIVLSWNACLAKWTGISCEDITGKDLRSFFPGISQSPCQVKLAKVFSGKGPVLFSARHYGKLFMSSISRSPYRVQQTRISAVPSFNASDYYALFTIEDITALTIRMSDFKTMRDKALEDVAIRSRIEEELKQKNQILQGILSATPIATILLENRLVTWGNEAARALFGYENEADYIGKDTRGFYASTAWFRAVGETILNSAPERSLIEMDVEFIRKNGDIFTGHLMVSCIDHENPLERNIVTISDLSTRMQAENDRIHREKLVSVLEMAGAVCHELNQPLMAISGYSELLLMDLDPAHPHFDKLTKIQNQIKKTGDITRKLMGITKYETRRYTESEKIFDLKTLNDPEMKR